MSENKTTGSGKRFGLVSVGHALVDILALVDGAFLKARGMQRGGMALIDGAGVAELEASLKREASRKNPSVKLEQEVSGGSVANSVAAFAACGGEGAFLGRTADDKRGKRFRDDMIAQGIEIPNPPAPAGAESTGCSYVLVTTPDGERTGNTYLGISAGLSADDVDVKTIAEAKVVLVEGYVFDLPRAREIFNKVAQAAHAAGTKIAFTVSDRRCVERHRKEFLEIIEKDVDIVFANEKETMALMEKDFDAAARDIAAKCEVAALTRGDKGAVIMAEGREYAIAPVVPKSFKSTNGAGDMFAGIFLRACDAGLGYAEAGKAAAMAASAKLGHIGARMPAAEICALLPLLSAAPSV